MLCCIFSFFCLSSSNIASVSGFSIADCPFGFLCRLFNILHSKELHNNFSVEQAICYSILENVNYIFVTGKLNTCIMTAFSFTLRD